MGDKPKKLTPNEDETKQIVAMLQTIVRNDETRFEHHQPRRWDGKRPTGGTIWLTPREMARRALDFLGADIPDAIAESLGD